MKVNMPVTDQEVQMKKGSFLVSRTNLKGVITYVNDAFVEISGFSREELVGTNHNIVRHPDMPAAAFEDMWSTITTGNPWTGLIKNRTKNGDFYWVEANVTPVFNNGKLDEFLSVRYPPKKEQILASQDFYQKLNDKQVQMRPKGFALILKKIKELKLAHKGWVALAGYLLPSMYLMYQSFEQGNYLILASVAVLNLIALLIGISIFRLFGDTLESTIGVCYAMSGGYYKNAIDLDRNDQIGDFYRALFSMQVKLNADLAYSNEVGAEAIRIKQALDNVSSNVMVADNSFDIIYLNASVSEMFKTAESDIQSELPDFKADQLLGANIDQFHRDPAYQRGMVTDLDDTMNSTLIIGGRHMDFIANPVNNEKGERIGTVVEWTDRTREVKIEHEIEDIVNSVKAGQLDTRIEMTDKDGFFEKLSSGINEMSDVINHVFNDVTGTVQSMATGDLSNRIEGRGFSVVATEVRNLAQRSATAAKESKELIQTSVTKVRSGTEFVNETGKSLNEIVVGVKKVGDIIAEIAAASSEQSQGIEQVNQAITQLDEITQQNAALAEQASAASVSMSDQSSQMTQILAFFNLGNQTTIEKTKPESQQTNSGSQPLTTKTVAPASHSAQNSDKGSTEDDGEWEEF